MSNLEIVKLLEELRYCKMRIDEGIEFDLDISEYQKRYNEIKAIIEVLSE